MCAASCVALNVADCCRLPRTAVPVWITTNMLMQCCSCPEQYDRHMRIELDEGYQVRSVNSAVTVLGSPQVFMAAAVQAAS